MVTSLKNLKNEIDSRLAGGSLSSLACCQLDNANSILANSIVHTVASCSSLPSASLNEGRFVYIDDIKEYRFSNEVWSDDLSSGVCAYQTQLWIWGSNSCGQLGDGTTTTRCSPVREICFATDWCQVCAAQTETLAIKTSGELWGWGRNRCSVLGHGTFISVCSPVREICSATDWCSVSSFGSHTVAVKTSGQIWGWGYNGSGRLGDGTATARFSPVREFCSATDWCDVSVGDGHTAAIKTSGQLWAWGCNATGELGDGTSVSKCSPVREFCSATDWCQVGSGTNHNAAIKTSGELWVWGYNGCGRLGDGTTVRKCSPVREFCSATDWCQASAGCLHTAVVKSSGQIWAWGRNNGGQLGDGTVTTRCSPVREFCSATNWCQVSTNGTFMAALKTSGQIWAWGINYCGQLGDGTVSARCSPVREVSSTTDWCQVSVGLYSAAALRSVSKGFLE